MWHKKTAHQGHKGGFSSSHHSLFKMTQEETQKMWDTRDPRKKKFYFSCWLCALSTHSRRVSFPPFSLQKSTLVCAMKNLNNNNGHSCVTSVFMEHPRKNFPATPFSAWVTANMVIIIIKWKSRLKAPLKVSYASCLSMKRRKLSVSMNECVHLFAPNALPCVPVHY